MRIRIIDPGETADQTREMLVSETDFLIGRGTDCDLRLSDSTISRHHCIIHLGPDEASLIDLGSSNGTYLNGQRVRSQAPLQSGDELQVGSCRFVVNLGDGDWVQPGRTGTEETVTTIRQVDLPNA
jgi:pSer/pThr/pTyr-binding forkhead associated (FHA) protein